MAKKTVDQRKLKKWAARGKGFRAAEYQLRKTEFTHQWAVARWMLAGEKEFGREAAYDAAEKATGFTRETLQQFAHTARKVLIRVKGVSFGHHRLVARLHPDTKAQKKELLFARKHKLNVEKFGLHLKGLARHDERQQKGPTNTDIAAQKFIETCDKIEVHWSLRALLSGTPPADRDGLVRKVRTTASKLNEIAESLQNHWQLYLPLPPSGGFSSKKHLDEWKSNEGWRRREEAKTAAAGSRG
jgi:hypothetical protein